MSENILEINKLNKNYKSFSLKNINFALPTGCIMGFIGPNGAGKTTTIKAILAMIKNDGGNIKVFGKDMENCKTEILQHIGVVMDEPYYSSDWTLLNVQSAISSFYENWDKEAYLRHLKQFDLSPNLKVKELSKGMKTKLMIAVAISHEAKLLILDEPSSGLDPVARDELMDILKEYVKGGQRGVFFSSHITSDLEKIADYISFIKDGEIIFAGLKNDLINMYKTVKGKTEEITREISQKLIGVKEGDGEFRALCLSKDISLLPETIIVEPADIENIMIHIYREGK